MTFASKASWTILAISVIAHCIESGWPAEKSYKSAPKTDAGLSLVFSSGTTKYGYRGNLTVPWSCLTDGQRH